MASRKFPFGTIPALIWVIAQQNTEWEQIGHRAARRGENELRRVGVSGALTFDLDWCWYWALVVKQHYAINVVEEYVIRGNAAVLRCNVPSFVVDFVSVSLWQDSEGQSYALQATQGW